MLNCCFNIDGYPAIPWNTIQKDGYTAEVTGPDAVRVLVATEAKPNQDVDSPLDREFFKSFLEVRPIKCHSSIDLVCSFKSLPML